MNIEELFTNSENPNIAFEKVIESSKNSIYLNRKLFDCENTLFGKINFNLLTKSINPRNYVTKDIKPLNIIGTKHRTKEFNKTFIEIFKQKEYRFLEHLGNDKSFNYRYFFESINKSNAEDMEFLSFNDKEGNIKYIIIHGHHRSIMASFLQMIDDNYTLKSVDVSELTIDWSKINTTHKFRSNYFDYEKLMSI